MKKGLTELVFVVDRSGSMGGLETDTIGGINATLALLLYKPVVTALRKANLVEARPSSSGGKNTKWGVVIGSAVLLVSFILLALVLAGVL